MTIPRKLEELLASAGVIIGGDEPHDIIVHDNRVFRRVALRGSIGLGDSYMDGWWDSGDLAETIARLATVDSWLLNTVAVAGSFWRQLQYRFRNLQALGHERKVAENHYDPFQDIYGPMLGDSMVYTCAYFGNGANELQQAQYDKLDLVCRKIGLRKGDRILDIGCGYGSFARHAAEYYGAAVVGSSISSGQLEIARELTDSSLPIEYRDQDYRLIDDGPYDHIVSIGMFEAVGLKNFRIFMETARAQLKPGGFFLLHSIGAERSGINFDPWIDKHIFENGMLPSLAQLSKATEGLFVIEDVHNFGADYDRTLMAWWENFDAAWEQLSKNYDERFYRMWKYYLQMCAGSFRSRKNQLYQLMLSPHGVPEGYESIR